MAGTGEVIELDLPDSLDEAENAIEVVRAFIADGSLVVTLQAGVFADNTNDWGRLLAGLAHNIARAHALEGTISEEEALAAIERGFIAATGQLTAKTTGSVPKRARH